MADITNNQHRPHLGMGLTFPLRVNLQGSPQLSSDIRNIEESIGIILGTKLGERVYRPNFGSRLFELSFAPMNTQTLLLIRLYVEEALKMWEPRITLDGVYTEPDPVRARVDIIIEYHPKDAHDSRSLVHPFYLQPSGE
ncbi:MULTISPECIES: GPW/gp25 family protein [unclassified Coleofasciculus]|uniref:GPW/gp25 family protein n=1 Tax=unclassified Coleofasciculus TaxID=2692782 RepID=UPI00187E576B|nr:MULTISPECIES: GPW/gp25 family protein [unclassified Coleofasciculus]MBE9126975.1 GPW/gp25 family protein [Coleofasciculus sp. LEGE 07081]MBE9150342.1 GPW/gp25 family protein [Coleofasciculus sp. LEGE 07092]